MRRARTAVALVPAITLAILVGACSPAASAPPSVRASAPPTSAAGSPGASGGAPTAAPPTPAPTPAGSLGRVEGWQSDLALIVPGIERIHPDPFRGTRKADIEAAVAALSADAAALTDDELLVGVARVAAMVSTRACDGHTGLFPWGTGSYPLESLPLRLWLFGDDLVIVDVLGEHRELIGATIEAIEGVPIAEVRELLDPLIPRDNEQTVRLLTPRYLLIPQVLRGIGLGNDRSVRIAYSQPGGRAEIDLEAVAMDAYNDWAGPYGLHLPADPEVRYLARMDEAVWWEILPDRGTLYVQYNRVEFLPTSTLDELRAAATDPDIDRVVLDIRHNFGGEVPALDDMEAILADPAVDQPGKLFVLVGRNTWSAGTLLLARLEAHTDAILVGEPMAGCPTFYGDVVELRLPHSGLVILVTEMLEVGVDPNDTRSNIELDAEVELSQEEWAAGEDPALDLIRVVAP